jgi:hypothetical protein
MQTENNRLTTRALQWIAGVHGQYHGERAPAEAADTPATGVIGFKSA